MAEGSKGKTVEVPKVEDAAESPVAPAAAPATAPAAASAPVVAPATAPPTQDVQPVVTEADEIEADEAEEQFDNDYDSATGTLGEDSTASLSSSIMKYREENGRTYHAYKDGAYLYPNDDEENDRLDLQHHLFLLTFDGKLSFAPLGKSVGRVLDVGTGTGVWAIDFADEHPEAEIIGTDLSPIQPSFLPPNVRFEIDDMEAEWTFTQPFQYIHCRMMTGSFVDWPKFFAQSYEHLEPGGYLELHEGAFPLHCDDNSLLPDDPMAQWGRMFVEASAMMGRSLEVMWNFQSQLADAGFEVVETLKYKWPQNPWPKDKKYKELGLWCLENIGGGLEGISIALFTRMLGWSPEEVLAWLPSVRASFRNRSIHAYYPIHAIVARKPLRVDAVAAA